MPRVLITGAAGFIGMHTSIRFLREGWDVVGLDNMNDYYSVPLKRDRIKEIEGITTDGMNEFTFREADLNSNIWSELELYDFDAVVHLAAQAGVRYSINNPRAYLEANILGFQSVLEFIENQRIRIFVYASSSSVYGMSSVQPFTETEPCNQPESYYAATKKANELMAQSYFKTKGVSSIGLRFFTVYGPWGRPDMAPFLFADAAFKEEPIKVFNYGKQGRDFTYIDDVVDGIFSLTSIDEFPKEALICNIGNGSPVSLTDFISMMEKYIGKELIKDYVSAQRGDVQFTYADTSLMESLVGYKSRVSLDKGIRLFIDWFKRYYGY